eukprot:UN27030
MTWDEANLRQNEKEKVPHQIIDEPPTPYEYTSQDEILNPELDKNVQKDKNSEQVLENSNIDVEPPTHRLNGKRSEVKGILDLMQNDPEYQKNLNPK